MLFIRHLEVIKCAWFETLVETFYRTSLHSFSPDVYYLAETWEGNYAVVSPSFLPKGATL
ncbi:hypothetical protein [Dolichospermum circinale]|uniref:hypothetical protein n=1 Tax=Dolichospermum circinale TaxID=109265 RepID=UPI00232F3008|nr:hypothetical protein [Dolichospermum circinale]MDB9463057.1 hypothetical protein [Dolichospermum circinale CS-541/04]MDB9546120.1 hypothetical protein [Dolichospermum circinale CS-1031]